MLARRAVQYCHLSRAPIPCINIIPRAYSSTPDLQNKSIIDLLETSKFQESAKLEPNKYKIQSFSRAVNVIKAHGHPITSPEDLTQLKGKGIGPRIAARIAAHLIQQPYNPDGKTKSVKILKLPEKMSPPDLAAVHALYTIPGVGKVKAMRLVQEGCRTLQQLREPPFYDMLTHPQQMGLKYLDEISKPVTREEAEALEKFVREYLNSKWEVILAGSYRRGSPTSSDIDLLFLHPSHVHIPAPDHKGKYELKYKLASPLNQDITEPLQRCGIAVAPLFYGTSKWQGIVRIPGRSDAGTWESIQTRLDAVESSRGTFRRADFTFVPLKTRGAALLSLTGDVDFNKDLRKRAQRLGMHLNEYGLWRFHPRDGDATPQNTSSELPKKEGHWELVASETEEEIFNELGMSWVDPEKRNFSFLMGSKTRTKAR